MADHKTNIHVTTSLVQEMEHCWIPEITLILVPYGWLAFSQRELLSCPVW